MVTFNLLPWRRLELKHQLTRVRRILLSSICLSLLITLLVHFVLLRLEKITETRIARLQQAALTNHAEKKTEESQLNQQISRYLQATQRLFAALDDGFDSLVCLSEFSRDGQYIRFVGHARSAADLGLFLKKWSGVNLFSQIQVEQLIEAEDGQVNFHLAGLENVGFPYQITNKDKSD